MLAFVRAMHEAKKPIAFICHAAWVPISAGILRGRTVTSVSAIQPRPQRRRWRHADSGYSKRTVACGYPYTTYASHVDSPDSLALRRAFVAATLSVWFERNPS